MDDRARAIGGTSDVAGESVPSPMRGRLFRKYLLLILSLVSGALLRLANDEVMRRLVGIRIEVEWEGRGATHRAQVTLAESPTLTATPEEVLPGGRLTDAQRALRARWLGPRAGATPR